MILEKSFSSAWHENVILCLAGVSDVIIEVHYSRPAYSKVPEVVAFF